MTFAPQLRAGLVGLALSLGTAQAFAAAAVGCAGLAAAMGIGRFAFTPLLPMMLHDGVLDLQSASGLATANYLGYWLGAVACALQPRLWARWGFTRPPLPARP